MYSSNIANETNGTANLSRIYTTNMGIGLQYSTSAELYLSYNNSYVNVFKIA